ncbi:uncharacterized protein STEHIDRAFT_170246 [Stereum hirsutum FP-91666 SS1]|uniref:uncharacterized protein n=1 Tax=Stereum hirsutum (strain FP-91666) TaxID=721885 RepID=UPI0004449E59|nr:uncharacterized protein STEHIDRAFT_170246 [Stereum hirsutum FP-91666 SS1]EIM83733.1 hypothetical protein STEHIDRAFT_170246 [Stereum hirsutum FP-91666 SS1]
MADTLTSYLESQASLVQQAALALPHQFSTCTHSQGYIRQSIYLCLTCALPRGICSACSIACHTDHEQLELFPKRHFRCDCPTTSIPHKCTLHKGTEGGEEDNAENHYGQNFEGLFCRCGRTYEAEKERETMIQCLACEDWFHESCLHLRERPSSRESTPVPDACPTTQGGPHDASTSTAQDANATAPVPDDSHDNDEDDAHSDASSSGLPPPLITASDYDALICSSCVRKIPILQRWAGTPGVMMVVRDHSSSPWKVLNGDTSNSKASRTATDAESQDVSVVDTSTEVSITTTTEYKLGDKRPLSPSSHDHDITTTDSKKPRTSPPPSTADPTPTPSTSQSRSRSQSHSRRCLAPPVDPTAQRIYASLRSEAQAQAPNLTSTSSSVSTSDVATLPECEGDIFLTDDWRTRWCRCDSCLPQLEVQPYLLEEEETYEPPEDPDSQLSLEELGVRALSRIPRERALDGIRAFNDMRDSLVSFLRPFAQQGKIVAEDDIRGFFEEKRQGQGGSS